MISKEWMSEETEVHEMNFRYVVVILLSVLTLSACANNHPANSDHASGSPASSITPDSQPQSSIEHELSTESVMIHSETELSNDCSVLIDYPCAKSRMKRVGEIYNQL